MPLTKLVDPFIRLFEFLTSLPYDKWIRVVFSILVIASCYFAFDTNDENKRLREEIKADTKQYAENKNKDNNDCLTYRLECENRIRLMEEAYRRVDTDRRDKDQINLEAKLKDIEKKLQSAEAHNRLRDKLERENKELEKKQSKI